MIVQNTQVPSTTTDTDTDTDILFSHSPYASGVQDAACEIFSVDEAR